MTLCSLAYKCLVSAALALLAPATAVAMVLLVATTADMVDQKATIVVMVDLVVTDVVLLLVDTNGSIVHLAMTTENQKPTEPMTLSKSTEITARTMASPSRS